MTDISSLGGLLLVIGVVRSGLGSLGTSNGRGYYCGVRVRRVYELRGKRLSMVY